MALTLLTQKLDPQPHDVESNQPELFSTPMKTEVLVEAAQHLGQMLLLLHPVDMHVLHQPGPDVIQEFPAALGGRDANDDIVALRVLPAQMLEAQKIKATSLASSVRRCTSPKRNSSRLLRRHLEVELRQPLANLPLKTHGFLRVLECGDEVIREADEVRLPPAQPEKSLLEPEVQCVVKVDVRQQRRNRSPLRRAFLRIHHDAAVEDASAKPLADEPENLRVADSKLQHPHQPLMAQVIEEPTNIRLENTSCPTGHRFVPEGGEGLMGIASRSESVGARKEVLLIDGAENPGYRALQ